MSKQADCSRGSITLEAALVFPVFLAVVLFLLNFIKLAGIYLAMDHAVSETAKTIAAHYFPLQYLAAGSSAGNSTQGLASSAANGMVTGGEGGLPGFDALEASLIREITARLVDKGSDMAVEAAVGEIARQKIMEYGALPIIRRGDFTVTRVKACNPAQPGPGGRAGPSSGRDIAITVNYRVKLAVPFFPAREFVLSNTAVERAWID